MSPFENHEILNNDHTFNQLVSAISEMKKKGITELDPEYISILQILKYYIYRKNTMNKLNSNSNSNSNNNNSSPNIINNQEDIQIFRSQIEAYKYLSRNLPIPAQLLANMSPLIVQDNSIKQPEVVDLKFYSKGLLQYDPSQHTPQQLQLQLQAQQQQQHAAQNGTIDQSQPTNITAIKLSNGTIENVKNLHDAYMAIDQREVHISNRLHYRLEELKELPYNLPSELKLKAQVEMKEIKLLELQRKLRNDITIENNGSIFYNSLGEIDLFIKPIPRATIAKPMDILFDKQSSEIPESILVTHKKKFLAAFFHHHKEFKNYEKNRKDFFKSLNSHLNRFFKEKERKEQERLRKERIQLLRNRDTEGYRELLSKTKNERLEVLMSQTDELLSSIHNLVQKEENDKKERDKVKGDDKEKDHSTDKDKEKEKEKDNTTNSNVTLPSNNSNATNNSNTTVIHKKSLSDDVITQPEIMTGGTLKEYQVTGLEWLVSLYKRDLNGILADEMGLGKTVQTIALVCHLYEKLNVREPFLIVAPLSTISNWSSEVLRWAPKLKVSTIIYKGKPEERKELARKIPKNGFSVVITSFEYILLDRTQLMRVPWCYIIVDEGHRIKNKSSKLAIQLRQYHSKHRLLLTGTPLQNDLGELWALLNFLLPKIFDSKDTFEHWFNAPFATKGTKNIIAVNEEESLIIINRLHQVLRFFLLRRLKLDVESQLPSKSEIVIRCNLSALQIVMYKSLHDRGILPIDPNSESFKKSTTGVKGFNNVVKQYQKICNHPYLFRDEWDINEDIIRASGKFDLMDQILMKMHATDHRVLIFTQMTEVINLMEEYFSLKDWDFLRLDGSTKPEERGHLVTEWNRPDSPFWIFVLSTHAGGLGMNLQTADTVIIFDSDWNPQMDLQAQDRCHRIGQTNAVNVYRLISAKSIEETILERATDKLEIDAKIIQAGMFNTHSNDQERRDKLKEFISGFPNSTNDEVPTDLSEINKLIARDEIEFNIFQKMDKEREAEELKRSKLTKQPIKPRLITEKELPDWLLHLPPVVDENTNVTPGKKRQTALEANSMLVDNLTDNQYARMVEKGMTVEQFRQYLAEKKEKRERRKTGEADSDEEDEDLSDSDDEEEDEEDDADDSDDGKKKKKQTVKRKVPSTPSTPSAKGRGRGRPSKPKSQPTTTDENGNTIVEDENGMNGTTEHSDENGTSNGTTPKGKRGRKKLKLSPQPNETTENNEESEEEEEEGEGEGEEGEDGPDTTMNGINEFDNLPTKRTRKPALKFALNTKSLNGTTEEVEPTNDVNNTPYKPGRRSTSAINSPVPSTQTPKSKSTGAKRGPKPKNQTIANTTIDETNNNNTNGDQSQDDSIDSIFNKIWERIHNAKDRNRKMSTLFWEKVDKEMYPEYYEVIKNPIAMDDIKQKKYTTPEEYLDDWRLMFSNALQFNDSTSQVYRDAISLYTIVCNELKANFESIMITELSPSSDKN